MSQYEKYCPRCHAAKVPVRGDPDWCLAVILFAIGFFPGVIYLLIFYSQTPNRCIICNSELVPMPMAPAPTTPVMQPQVNVVLSDPQPQSAPVQVVTPQPQSTVEKNAPKYCPYCGAERRSGAAFCANCGTAL